MSDGSPVDEPGGETSPPRQANGNHKGRFPQVRTRTIALWALAIAIGHVIYHALRDHVFPDAY